MSNVRVSAGQLLVDHLFRGVQVIEEPTEKLQYGTDKQQVRGDLRGWIVPVAVPRGVLVEELRVTLWASVRPSVHAGDLVKFRQVVFGAVEGRIYTQAYLMEAISDDES